MRTHILPRWASRAGKTPRRGVGAPGARLALRAALTGVVGLALAGGAPARAAPPNSAAMPPSAAPPPPAAQETSAARETSAEPPTKQLRPAERRAVVTALVVRDATLPVALGGKAGERVTVVVQAGRVTCLGRSCKSPTGARVLDVGGANVLPGLVEAAAHIGQVEVSLEPSSHDGDIKGLDNAAHVRAADGVHMNSRVVRAALRGGVTVALSAPRGPALVVGQSAALDLSANQVGDATLAPSVAVHAQVGNGAKRHRGRAEVGARSGQFALLRALLSEAAARMAAPNTPRPWTLGTRSTLAGLQALYPLLARKLPLVVHAHRAGDILAALRLARAFKLRLVIVGGAEAHVVARQLAAAKVPVVVAPVVARPDSFDTARALPSNAARLHKAGVTLALSTARTHNARNLRWQAGLAVAHGLPHGAALRAVTTAFGDIFGVDSGGLRVGSRANFVVCDGDPLSLQGRIRHVVVGRRLLSDPRQR